MKSTFARILAATALVTLFAVGCDDDGGGGTAGLPDARGGTVFPDAAPPAPDAPPVVVVPDAPGTTGPLACSIEEVTPLFQCALENCIEIPTDLPDGGGLPAFDFGSIGTCAITSCGALIFDLSPSCQGCLISAFTGGTTGALEGCINGGLPELPGGLPTPP